MKVVGECSDEGKSGKNITGRPEFQKMLDDIKDGKDKVDYVLVFKLSRFGRNAADTLNSLQYMEDFGVNLLCVEDSIDSAGASGKLMISVLAAVAEIERENIKEQTMAGRQQKARDGKWNGGFAPYGYKLIHKEGEKLLTYREGNYFIPAMQPDVDKYADLGKMVSFGQDFGIPDRMDKLQQIVRRVSSVCRHGTSIVFMEKRGIAAEIDNRLSRYRRGFKVKPFALAEAKEEVLQGITAIDGAVFADLSGDCHAIGVMSMVRWSWRGIMAGERAIILSKTILQDIK